MKKITIEKVSKKFDIDDESLYAAIGRGRLKCSKKGSKRYIGLNQKAKDTLVEIKKLQDTKKKTIKSLKKELQLKERIIDAKNEVIKAKDHELVNIKEIYNNLLHLYNESKTLRSKSDLPIKEKKEHVEIEDGYTLISGTLFSKRLHDFGLSLDEIKELLVKNIIEGRIDYSDGNLVIEDNFFHQFQKKSDYWEKRN